MRVVERRRGGFAPLLSPLCLCVPPRPLSRPGHHVHVHEKMKEDFLKSNTPITPEQLQRIYAPCGLEIGANSPEEIASSIFAEILSVYSDKKGGLLRDKTEPIHERF